jgi:hypothetical protein
MYDNTDADMLLARPEDERLQRLRARVSDLRARFILRREKWKVKSSADPGLVWYVTNLFFLLYMFIHKKTFCTIYTESAPGSQFSGMPALLFIPSPGNRMARR